MKYIGTILTASVAAAVFGTTTLQADPADDIAWIALAEIKETSDLEAVDSLIAEVTTAVGANPGTLAFDIARVGNSLYIYERIDNQAALMAHAGIVMEYMPRMQELWFTTQMVPTRKLASDVETMMVGFGATIPETASAISR